MLLCQSEKKKVKFKHEEISEIIGAISICKPEKKKVKLSEIIGTILICKPEKKKLKFCEISGAIFICKPEKKKEKSVKSLVQFSYANLKRKS